MQVLEIIFWVSLGCVAYTYLVYPLALGLLAKLRSRPPLKAPYTGSADIVLVVRNEEKALPRRLRELTGLLESSGLDGRVIVVSDGSTDNTVAIAETFAETNRVLVVALTDNVGKAAALTQGCQHATADVLVFADVRQCWADDVLQVLLQNFADPAVGAVTGSLVLESAPGVLAGVGLYWRVETWMRRQESQLHSQVGVTGAISAVRRGLFRPIPQGTLTDDVYWPMQVVMQGFRVVNEPGALAFDRLPARASDEFRRKVRTQCGILQLLGRLPASLLPWRNPVWIAWVSHKLLRLVVPWALLAMFAINMVLPGPVYRGMMWAQVVGLGLVLLGLATPLGKRVRVLGAAGSFLLLNAAAWVAFWVWLTGRSQSAWKQVNYAKNPAGVAHPRPDVPAHVPSAGDTPALTGAREEDS